MSPSVGVGVRVLYDIHFAPSGAVNSTSRSVARYRRETASTDVWTGGSRVNNSGLAVFDPVAVTTVETVDIPLLNPLLLP